LVLKPLVLSVPHTGTRALARFAEAKILHVEQANDEEVANTGANLFLVPLRDPAMCYASWHKRGAHRDYPMDFFASWRRLAELVEKYRPLFLCVDRLVRYEQLKRIAEPLGKDPRLIRWAFQSETVPNVPTTRLVIPDLSEIYAMPFVAEHY
jgi:hypothetical protein